MYQKPPFHRSDEEALRSEVSQSCHQVRLSGFSVGSLALSLNNLSVLKIVGNLTKSTPIVEM